MPKFKKGHRGGPGRPKGSRNKITLMLDAIAQAGAVGMVRAMVRKGLGGDVPAAKLVFPHIWPVGTFVKIDLPAVTDATGIAEAHACLIAEVANEGISLEQAGWLSTLLENRRRALETVEIERNLQQVKENLAARDAAERNRRP